MQDVWEASVSNGWQTQVINFAQLITRSLSFHKVHKCFGTSVTMLILQMRKLRLEETLTFAVSREANI